MPFYARNTMVQNTELYDIAMDKMFDAYADSLHYIVDVDESAQLKEALIPAVQIFEEESHRIRLILPVGPMFVVAYDFDKTREEDSTPARQLYDESLERIKAMKGLGMEYINSEGIVNDRFGWYATSFN